MIDRGTRPEEPALLQKKYENALKRLEKALEQVNQLGNSVNELRNENNALRLSIVDAKMQGFGKQNDDVRRQAE